MQELKHHTFIVTGGTRGIGKATAQKLCGLGAKVCITGRSQDTLDQVKIAIDPTGKNVIAVAQDVQKSSSWEQVFAETIRAFGFVHGLVNNAGIHKMHALDKTLEADFDCIMATNAKSVFLGTQKAFEVLPEFVSAQNPGSVVNVSSIAGLVGTSFQSAYSMSKGAVQIFSLAAAREAIDRKLPIRVNTVNPGMVETDMGGELAEELVANGLAQNMEQARKGLVKNYMDNRFSTPAEVANSICFLLSNSASHTTGCALKVDGGMTNS